jgi:HD-GYP domain-containing protein (c-di-GMP phosphodiesterase class II)
VIGDDIPLVGRIVAVADVFDALTHDRPYKPAWPVDQAVALIRSSGGSQFDPRVVEAFLAIVGHLRGPSPQPEARVRAPGAPGAPPARPRQHRAGQRRALGGAC